MFYNAKIFSITNLYRTLYLCLFFNSMLFAGIVITVPSSGASTISSAILKARPGDTVYVEDGIYKEHIFIKAGVVLKAQNRHKAIIDGKSKGTVVTMGASSTMIGFTVRNGTIGIFSKNAGVCVLNCQVINNWLTGIITVRHLPKIEDNIIAFNRSSGIQGWDVRSTVASINHNTIAFNSNHGISVGGSSNIIVENNVVAYNERFGLKISSESEASKIMRNNFYNNLKQKIPTGNYSFDPAFISPRKDLNFSSDPKLCCQIKASDDENLGARLLQY